ncbi:MAG: hypothetical protein HQL31_09675, partial [Planctomycetes bacterium]|nr:hypothetical protein [Planctomycetota bacterium]
PYAISTSLLWNLMRQAGWYSAHFMVQRECFKRLTSPPGGKEYGAIGVVMALGCEIEKVLAVPGSAFWPRPSVESVFFSLRPRPEGLPDLELMSFLQLAFSHRRKSLGNILRSMSPRSEHEVIERVLAGMSPKVRAEELSPGELRDLAHGLAGLLR